MACELQLIKLMKHMILVEFADQVKAFLPPEQHDHTPLAECLDDSTMAAINLRINSVIAWLLGDCEVEGFEGTSVDDQSLTWDVGRNTTERITLADVIEFINQS